MKKVEYIKSLDGLRGCAVLLVMWVHYAANSELATTGLLKAFAKASSFGRTGVDLFFVLSGFLITRILLNSKTDSNYFRNFYFKRVLRIFPLYYAFLVFTYFIQPYFQGVAFPSFGRQIWYWLYLQNFPTPFNLDVSSGPVHFWSLAVEEHFYFLWPYIVYKASSQKLFKISLFIALFAFVLRLIFWKFELNGYYFTLCRMDSLVIGAMLSVAEYFYDLRRFRREFLTILLFAAPAVLALWSFDFTRRSGFISSFTALLINVFYVAAIGVLMTKNHGVTNSLFTSKLLVYTGKISYGLYVFHPLCFGYIHNAKLGVGFWSDMAIAFLASYLLSTFSYYYFEKFFLQLKDRYYLSPSSQPA